MWEEEPNPEEFAIAIPAEVMASEFAKIVDSISAAAPELPPKIAQVAQLCCDEYSVKSENDWQFTPKKALMIRNIIGACLNLDPAQPQAEVIRTAAAFCDDILQVLSLPRVMWGHFIFNLPETTFCATDIGMAALTKKYGERPQVYRHPDPRDTAPVARGGRLWGAKKGSK